MPRGRKSRTQSTAAPQPIETLGLGLDPEAEADAKAEAESPEGDALFQELKRMEEVAHTGPDLESIVDAPVPVIPVVADAPDPPATGALPVAVSAADEDEEEAEPWVDEDE